MFLIFAYISQEFLVAMWDGISVPFIEHHACAEMNFGKSDPKCCCLPRELMGAMWDGISVPGLTPRMRRNKRHVFSDKKNKFNKTIHYTTLHYTFSFSLVCMMPLTIFSVLVFRPGKRLILAIIFLSAFHLSLSDLALL